MAAAVTPGAGQTSDDTYDLIVIGAGPGGYIAAIRAADGALSLAWRLYVRTMLEQAFAAGYTMVDCIRIGDKGWHYVLVREYV